MKILHITGDSKWGGGGVVIEALIRMAVERGWTASMLTTDPRCQSAIREVGAGIVDLDVIWRDIKPLRDLKGLWKLYRHLRVHRYDVVHTHTSKAGFVGRIAAKLAGVPVVVHTVHGFAFHEETAWKTVAFYSLLEKIAARFCDSIVTVSHYHREWAVRLGISSPEKLQAIPNGIDGERLTSGRSGREFRDRVGASDKSFVVVTHGRLAEGKGLEYLISAIPKLKNRMKRDCKFVFVGDGPQRTGLETLAAELNVSDQVVFDGFQSDIGGVLAGADVVVLPTLREGLSISLLESMAARKPVVATSIGSNLEATDQGRCAIMVPTKDSDALADAIEALSADPDRARSLGEAAGTRFDGLYRESQMTSAYERLYEDLLIRRCLAWTGPAPQFAQEAKA